MKYKCITKCFYRSRLYSVGESIDLEDGEQPSKHFVPINKFRKKITDPKVVDQKAVEALGHTKNTSDVPEKVKPSKSKRKSKDQDFLE